MFMVKQNDYLNKQIKIFVITLQDIRNAFLYRCFYDLKMLKA